MAKKSRKNRIIIKKLKDALFENEFFTIMEFAEYYSFSRAAIYRAAYGKYKKGQVRDTLIKNGFNPDMVIKLVEKELREVANV